MGGRPSPLPRQPELGKRRYASYWNAFLFLGMFVCLEETNLLDDPVPTYGIDRHGNTVLQPGKCIRVSGKLTN